MAVHIIFISPNINRSRMNIGIDARKLGKTGIGRYVQELTKELAEQNPKDNFYLIVSPNYKDHLDDDLVEQENVSAHISLAGYYSLSEQLDFGRELDRLGLDLIHFPNFNVPQFIKTPYVITVHDLTLLHYPGRRMFFGKRLFYRYVLGKALKRAQYIITDSKDSKRDIKSFMSHGRIRNKKKIRVVPLAAARIFKEKVSKLHQSQGIKSLGLASPYFLAVGSDLKHKNIRRIIKAFLKLAKGSDQPYKLALVGKYNQTGPILNLINNSDTLATRVTVMGAVTDKELRILYKGAQALVFVSLKEGFGLPILEAFKAGCLVITSNKSSMKEIAGKGAIIVDPQKTDSIYAAMRDSVEKPKLVLKKKMVGRKIAKKYSWSKTARLTYAIYEKAIEE